MYKSVAKTIETHTMGEPTRIIYDGLPTIKGKTMIEKKEYFKNNYDNYRKLLLLEPRGHKNMFGAILTSPCNERADIGVIFIDNDGYLDMCVHGSMGISVALYEKLGIKNEKIILDTPSGTIETNLEIKNNEIEKVSIKNVESFLYKSNQELYLEGFGKINYDICYGGNFFALINVDELNIKIEYKNKEKLEEIGMKVKEEINNNVDLHHELFGKIIINLVEFYEEYSPTYFKNFVVFGNKQIDRSPCGTGTSAKLAQLYYYKKIGINEDIIVESIIGTKFIGRIIDYRENHGYNLIIPIIEGNAFIIGYNNYVISNLDKIKSGFIL